MEFSFNTLYQFPIASLIIRSEIEELMELKEKETNLEQTIKAKVKKICKDMDWDDEYYCYPPYVDVDIGRYSLSVIVQVNNPEKNLFGMIEAIEEIVGFQVEKVDIEAHLREDFIMKSFFATLRFSIKEYVWDEELC